MKKYIINLPSGKQIKYRVTQRTENWTLIEAVIDEETLAFLNHFASTGDAQQATTADVPAAAPAAPAAPSTRPATDFTDEQKQKMKQVKAKLGFKSNEQLNGFVQEWSLYNGKTWHYLNGSNIDSFITYLYDKIL